MKGTAGLGVVVLFLLAGCAQGEAPAPCLGRTIEAQDYTICEPPGVTLEDSSPYPNVGWNNRTGYISITDETPPSGYETAEKVVAEWLPRPSDCSTGGNLTTGSIQDARIGLRPAVGSWWSCSTHYQDTSFTDGQVLALMIHGRAVFIQGSVGRPAEPSKVALIQEIQDSIRFR